VESAFTISQSRASQAIVSDSGTTTTVTPRLDLLTDLKKCNVQVVVASGEIVEVKLEGRMGGIDRAFYSPSITNLPTP